MANSSKDRKKPRNTCNWILDFKINKLINSTSFCGYFLSSNCVFLQTKSRYVYFLKLSALILNSKPSKTNNTENIQSMLSGFQGLKENLVTVLQSFSISFSSHFYHASWALPEPYQNKIMTVVMSMKKLWPTQCPCRSMIEFSSEVFRVFVVTISDKNGLPVTSYGVTALTAASRYFLLPIFNLLKQFFRGFWTRF